MFLLLLNFKQERTPWGAQSLHLWIQNIPGINPTLSRKRNQGLWSSTGLRCDTCAKVPSSALPPLPCHFWSICENRLTGFCVWLTLSSLARPADSTSVWVGDHSGGFLAVRSRFRCGGLHELKWGLKILYTQTWILNPENTETGNSSFLQ